MIVKLLTEHHLEFLSLEGDCTGLSESSPVKMPHCWKSHALAHFCLHAKHGRHIGIVIIIYVGITFEPRRDFQQCGILTSVDSDEAVQPLFKLRNSKFCSVSSLTFIKYSSD